jgi:cyclopropane fatty-acyl-phospholipid synthase-like methyltransferase
MMNDEIGDLVAQGYDRVADEYAALESAHVPWPRLGRVKAFIAGLPDGSRVLDLGCGNGVPATRVIAQRHVVTGVDISPEQIARAKSNIPAASFHCADAREIDFAQGSFDAVVALYLIDNIPAQDYPSLFRKLAGWLKPGGRILLCAEPGNDPGRTYEWLGVPMFINTLPASEVAAMLEDASLRVLETDSETQLEGGREIEYVWFVAEACRYVA